MQEAIRPFLAFVLNSMAKQPCSVGEEQALRSMLALMQKGIRVADEEETACEIT